MSSVNGYGSSQSNMYQTSQSTRSHGQSTVQPVQTRTVHQRVSDAIHQQAPISQSNRPSPSLSSSHGQRVSTGQQSSNVSKVTSQSQSIIQQPIMIDLVPYIKDESIYTLRACLAKYKNQNVPTMVAVSHIDRKEGLEICKALIEDPKFKLFLKPQGVKTLQELQNVMEEDKHTLCNAFEEFGYSSFHGLNFNEIYGDYNNLEGYEVTKDKLVSKKEFSANLVIEKEHGFVVAICKPETAHDIWLQKGNYTRTIEVNGRKEIARYSIDKMRIVNDQEFKEICEKKLRQK